MKRLAMIMVCVVGLSTAPVLATDLSYEGWGVRAGVADDPDQVVIGAHWVLEGLAPNLRFMPNVEIGLGDDHTVLALTAPAHYMFRDLDTDFTPYAGGGLTLGFVDRDNDRGRGDDDDLEIALRVTGGLEWSLREHRAFFVELNVIGGDVHDVQVVAGLTFRRSR